MSQVGPTRPMSEMSEEELWAAVDPYGQAAKLLETSWSGGTLRVGDRVLLQPTGRADIFDLALAGMVGVVEAIEQDYEDQVQVAVVIEGDPGRDLGELRQPGHRFFFKLAEIAPVGEPG